jgi:hypothetical protein
MVSIETNAKDNFMQNFCALTFVPTIGGTMNMYEKIKNVYFLHIASVDLLKINK